MTDFMAEEPIFITLRPNAAEQCSGNRQDTSASDDLNLYDDYQGCREGSLPDFDLPHARDSRDLDSDCGDNFREYEARSVIDGFASSNSLVSELRLGELQSAHVKSEVGKYLTKDCDSHTHSDSPSETEGRSHAANNNLSPSDRCSSSPSHFGSPTAGASESHHESCSGLASLQEKAFCDNGSDPCITSSDSFNLSASSVGGEQSPSSIGSKYGEIVSSVQGDTSANAIRMSVDTNSNRTLNTAKTSRFTVQLTPEVNSKVFDLTKNHDTESKTSSMVPKKKVSFPEDKSLIKGCAHAPNPWYNVSFCSTENLVSAYVDSCERHGVRPLSALVSQLQCIREFGERINLLMLKGEHLTIRHVETLEEIFRRIQFNTIDMDSTHLDDEAAIAIFDMIEYYESAAHLKISNNKNIGIRAWLACARMIRKTPSLESLDVRSCSLNDQCIATLGRAMRMGSFVSVLHLEDCGLAFKGIMILSAALRTSPVIRELYLGDNALLPSDGLQIGNLLRNNTHVRTLDVRNNNLQDIGVAHLCEGLADQPGGFGLQSLVMSSNHITCHAMAALVKALSATRSLESLNLSNNPLSNEGIYTLKEGLLKNKSVMRLSLQCTKISCEGAVALAEYIADSYSIAQLDLRENDIKTAGLLALTMCLKVHQTVTRLELDQQVKKESAVKDYQIQQRSFLDEIQAQLHRNSEAEREKVQKLLEMQASQIVSVTKPMSPSEPNPPSVCSSVAESTTDPAKQGKYFDPLMAVVNEEYLEVAISDGHDTEMASGVAEEQEENATCESTKENMTAYDTFKIDITMHEQGYDISGNVESGSAPVIDQERDITVQQTAQLQGQHSDFSVMGTNSNNHGNGKQDAEAILNGEVCSVDALQSPALVEKILVMEAVSIANSANRTVGDKAQRALDGAVIPTMEAEAGIHGALSTERTIEDAAQGVVLCVTDNIFGCIDRGDRRSADIAPFISSIIVEPLVDINETPELLSAQLVPNYTPTSDDPQQLPTQEVSAKIGGSAALAACNIQLGSEVVDRDDEAADMAASRSDIRGESDASVSGCLSQILVCPEGISHPFKIPETDPGHAATEGCTHSSLSRSAAKNQEISCGSQSPAYNVLLTVEAPAPLSDNGEVPAPLYEDLFSELAIQTSTAVLLGVDSSNQHSAGLNMCNQPLVFSPDVEALNETPGESFKEALNKAQRDPCLSSLWSYESVNGSKPSPSDASSLVLDPNCQYHHVKPVDTDCLLFEESGISQEINPPIDNVCSTAASGVADLQHGDTKKSGDHLHSPNSFGLADIGIDDKQSYST